MAPEKSNWQDAVPKVPLYLGHMNGIRDPSGIVRLIQLA